MDLELVVGDLTKQAVDAIVNAANRTLGGGGGVDGAIHRAAGPELLKACRALPQMEPGVRCPTGEARITPGFRLAARYVIHTVGPVYDVTEAEACDELLARAHRSTLAVAEEAGLETVAFPAISCGAYGFPLARAGQIARRVVAAHGATSVRLVRFVLFDEPALREFGRRTL